MPLNKSVFLNDLELCNCHEEKKHSDCTWGQTTEGGGGWSYVFLTVPNSRINSWESWFIFNLQKNNSQAWGRIIDSIEINNPE
jgi:hypothetical protein